LLAACDGFYVTKYVRVLRGKERATEATITRRNPQLRALIILAIDSGCRLGELVKLRWKDLDLARNSIRVLGSHTKTERERHVFLTERAKIELNRIRSPRATGDSAVFGTKSVKRSFKKALSIAGIADFHFHDLRRTGVSRWQASGVPLAMAQKLAGHNDSKMTARVYTATSDEMHVQFVENLNAYYTTPGTPLEPAREFVN
jgi:integrase